MTLNPMWMTFAIAVLAAVVVILAIMLVVLTVRNRKLKADYDDLSEIVHGLNNDFRDFYTTALTLDERLVTVDGRIHELAEKIAALQQNAPADHPYSMAIQKVRSGASVGELMQSAGLSQDEAALLIRLHGSKAR